MTVRRIYFRILTNQFVTAKLRNVLDREMERPRTPDCLLCYESFSTMESMMVHRTKQHPEAWAWLKLQLEAQKKRE